MYLRKKVSLTLLRGLLACFFAFVVCGCSRGPTRTEWSASDLESMVKELKANGINASSEKIHLNNVLYFDKSTGKIYARDTLYLDICLENKNEIKMPFYKDIPSRDEIDARRTERNAIYEANKLALQEAVQKDFEIIGRVLRGKKIPLLKFSGPGQFGILSRVSTLECQYLGLWLNFDPDPDSLKILRDMPALKRLYVNDGNTLQRFLELPQVEDVSIEILSSPTFFKIESVARAFPNIRSLTLPYSVPPIDYGAAKFPASLTTFNIPLTQGNNPIISAYNLNGAKNLPGITHINSFPKGEFDPLKNFTPEQRTQYNAIPAHIWAEKRFAAFRDQPQKKFGPVPLRGKIMLHAEGSFLPLKAYEGLDERLRNALTEDPDECDVLIVIATTAVRAIGVKRLGEPDGTNNPVFHGVTSIYLLSRNGECETHAVFFEPPLAGISEEQHQRNVRYRTSGAWGEIELLFKKANPE